MSDAWLQHRYNEFNKSYFGNSLPNSTVRFSNVCGNGLGVSFMVTHPTTKLAMAFLIFINSNLWSADLIELTLLHEMAHLRTWGNKHGKKWQKEMHRLAAMGAFNERW